MSFLPIDHQYYDRKIIFCKQYRSGNCLPGIWETINKLKKDNKADKPGAEAVAASTSISSGASLFNPRSSAQPELVQALGTQDSLNKFVSFAMKYVDAIPMLITIVDGKFVNSKAQEID